MGCDGGTIPRRDELVKVKKKPEQKDKNADLIFQWKYCSLTQVPLQRPIVTCGLGKFYNKSAILEALIEKSAPNHIKSLKDVKELQLSVNPNFTTSLREVQDCSEFICPLTGLEMSGNFRFVCLWNCGCVFSERGLKEIATDSCPRCLRTFQPFDWVVLNPGQDETKLMQERMLERKKKRRK